MTEEARDLWESIARPLAEQVSQVVWQTTFREVRGTAFDGECLTLEVPSALVRDRIETRYRSLLSQAITDSGLSGIELLVEVVVEESAHDESPNELPNKVLDESSERRRTTPVVEPDNVREANNDQRIEDSSPKRYTFDTFVTGPSNRFAQAAALSVAETPARSYNPLFVYGSAGLGKTHLLKAIAHYVRNIYPNYRVRYISTEEMLNEFVEAIRNNTQVQFKRRYREIDVLLVDDIQFMEGKEQLQEEFFHTFNTLHEAHRQIVLSSDRPPDAIATLEDRLRSRFKMGLITDIQPPDFETRLAIVSKKAEEANIALPPDVIEFIVSSITNNIRELEGALNRVTAHVNLNEEVPDLDGVKIILADIQRADSRPIRPNDILEATAAKYGFTVEELISRSRRRPLVTARQVGMYLFRELTELSYPETAKIFGGRDHTTVIHAYEKIKNLMNERATIYEDVQWLVRQIKTERPA